MTPNTPQAIYRSRFTLAKAAAVGAAGGFGKKAGEKLWEIFAGRIKTRD